MKIGIVGKGFVGSAVANGFNKGTEQFIVDPNYSNNTIEGLIEFRSCITFVCVPTPVTEDGSCDVTIAQKFYKSFNRD